MKPAAATLALAVTAILQSCGGASDSQTAIPRREAYPRIQTYDTAMVEIDQAAPVRILANAQADVTIPDNAENAKTGTRWFNIAYPRYGATIHYTITNAANQDRQAVIDNRVERMSLNSGGLPTEILEMQSPGGFHSQLLHTPAGSVTPLQFLATDGNQWVISGALYFDGIITDSPADSIAPMVEAVKSDLIRSLSSLSAR